MARFIFKHAVKFSRPVPGVLAPGRVYPPHGTTCRTRTDDVPAVAPGGNNLATQLAHRITGNTVYVDGGTNIVA